MEKTIEKYCGFIEQMISRPAMYGINKVEDIQIFSFGYLVALSSEEGDRLEIFLGKFNDFVTSNYKMETDNRWERVIRFYSGSDAHSILLFSDLFSRYTDKERENI